MRLLRYEDNGHLTITTFDDNALPRYAILSHTWGADAHEVTFADLAEGGSRHKSGYQKIRFCGEQARRDALQYLWVDTCCIDKSDKAELSSSIQSMFRWYQNATKCYVYLVDVSTRKRKADSIFADSTWEPAFRSSRWFTRGWTLQELLAPSIVEFFSQEWEKLGDKISLKSLICKATGMPYKALDGSPLSRFSVDERLRWKGDRKTKREEDGWYSMAGILDVEIAPAYTEGAASAFTRLMDKIHTQERCVQDVRHTDPRDDKKRIENTKGGLLVDSYRWVLDNITFQQWKQDPHSRLLWVKGDPGKGKTMLLCGIIDELYKLIPSTALLSYFFCQATDSRINSATAVLRGLLYMLIVQQPSLTSHVRKKHDHAGKNLFEDANAWEALTEIFEDVLRDPSLRPTYLVIDALDECLTDLPMLLDFVGKQSSLSSRVKWIVSSRNWPEIKAQLERAGHKVKLSLELNAESVAAAVNVFVQQKVDQLAREKQYGEDIRHEVLQHLNSHANDTFLWVALVCQELQRTANRNVLKKLALFPPGLDALYARMMQQMSDCDDAELCRCVLASTAVLYRPVTIRELVALVEQLKDLVDELGSVREIIGLCGSFLTLRDDTVYFVHQSAKDFLFAQRSSKVFPAGAEDVHQQVFLRSLAILSKTLHKDMYSLKALGFPIEDVMTPVPDLLAESRYPCIYWIDHLCDSKLKSWAEGVTSDQVAAISVFLQKKYLYWLEGLSLCKSVGRGVVSMKRLWSLVGDMGDQDSFTQLVQDAQRFIMYHNGAIENYPLQTYASALLFSPADSIIRHLFQHEEPEGISIKPPLNGGWSACLQTLEGHSRCVYSVAFSHDSARLASASEDSTVKIWDTHSGTCLQTLVGHSGWVNSVAFSYDSAQIASASADNTIKIWDTHSGDCLQTLQGHSSWVNSVTFSHDSAHLASASADNTIKIWNVRRGTCLQTLEGHSGYVYSVAFSHDSARLASASGDSTVKIWDTRTGKCLQTLTDHSYFVYSVAFSHDSAQLASTSQDRTARIWDASSGKCLRIVKGHSDYVRSVAFSNDSTRIATASEDSTVKIWDTRSGKCLQTLRAHSGWVNSVAFSHDSAQIASASADNTVKIWDVGSGDCPQLLQDHNGWVDSLALPHNAVRLAPASNDNAHSGECLQMLEGHSQRVCSVAFSHDSARLASGSWDSTVKIWDIRSGDCLQTLKGHRGWVELVVFSYDSVRLASASEDHTIKIWNAHNGDCLQTLGGYGGWCRPIIFSYDSVRLASTSSDNIVKIWDTHSGDCLQMLGSHGGWSQKPVVFAHDSVRLASLSTYTTVKIWDTRSGKCLQTLEGHSRRVYSVAFSHDSARLASASEDSTVKIWDTHSGTCLQTLVGHSGWVNSVAFSYNSAQIALASADNTIKIWDTRRGDCFRILSVGKKVLNIKFDDTGSYLYTEVGTIAIDACYSSPSVIDPQNPRYVGGSLSSDGAWIKCNSENLVWVPSEYRPSCSAVSGKAIGIGVDSGKVWICNLKPIGSEEFMMIV